MRLHGACHIQITRTSGLFIFLVKELTDSDVQPKDETKNGGSGCDVSPAGFHQTIVHQPFTVLSSDEARRAKRHICFLHFSSLSFGWTSLPVSFPGCTILEGLLMCHPWLAVDNSISVVVFQGFRSRHERMLAFPFHSMTRLETQAAGIITSASILSCVNCPNPLAYSKQSKKIAGVAFSLLEWSLLFLNELALENVQGYCQKHPKIVMWCPLCFVPCFAVMR